MSGVAVITEACIGTKDRACVDVFPVGDQSAFADLDDEIAPHVFAIMTLLGADPDPVEATEQALLEIRRTAPRYSPCEGSARAWCLNIAYQLALRSHGAGHRPEVPDEH